MAEQLPSSVKKPILDAARTGNPEIMARAIEEVNPTLVQVNALIHLATGDWREHLERAKASEVLFQVLKSKQRLLEATATGTAPQPEATSTQSERPAPGPSRGTRAIPNVTPITRAPEGWSSKTASAR